MRLVSLGAPCKRQYAYIQRSTIAGDAHSRDGETSRAPARRQPDQGPCSSV